MKLGNRHMPSRSELGIALKLKDLSLRTTLTSCLALAAFSVGCSGVLFAQQVNPPGGAPGVGGPPAGGQGGSPGGPPGAGGPPAGG